MSKPYTDVLPAVNTSAPIDNSYTATSEGDLSMPIHVIKIEGTTIYYTDNQQAKELIFDEYKKDPRLNMYFSLEGTSAVHPKSTDSQLVLTDNQHIVQYTPHFEGQYSIRGPKLRNFGISLNASFFQRLMITDFECLQRFWDKTLNEQLTYISPFPMSVTPRQKAVINDIQHCPYTGQMRNLYYESKIVELFLLQAEQAESLERRHPISLKATDSDKLHAARNYVKQHMLEPLTLYQIAREAGLNDFKLKKGFKELFGCTVFSYLNELRMEHARQLLLDTACTVFEVAYTLGYNESHNFTKAFKKHFGYLPSELKDQPMGRR